MSRWRSAGLVVGGRWPCFGLVVKDGMGTRAGGKERFDKYFAILFPSLLRHRDGFWI